MLDDAFFDDVEQLASHLKKLKPDDNYLNSLIHFRAIYNRWPKSHKELKKEINKLAKQKAKLDSKEVLK